MHRFVASGPSRLDTFLATAVPGLSRRRWMQTWEACDVRVNGKRADKGRQLVAGDEVTVAALPPSNADLLPVADADAAARITVLLTTPTFVAINKPAGMASQPLRAGERGSAASAIAALFPECASLGDDPRDGGLVHRLDTGTSGVLVAARSSEAWHAMRQAFADGSIEKTYLAITRGAPFSKHIIAPLEQRGKRAVVDATGLDAETWLDVIASHGDAALVRCRARTGRMHQIRAHLAHVGTPLIGDALYGDKHAVASATDGFYLHAESFTSPLLTVTAPVQASFRQVAETLGLTI